MAFKDLREFIELLEAEGELKRISVPVDPNLEITEICDRTLRAGGPALLFENPKGSSIPLLGNLFGNTRRIALGESSHLEAGTQYCAQRQKKRTVPGRGDRGR